jgi:hypothetical protein
MAWDRGYYYRSRKVNGRVVREYVGAGRAAQLAAQLDASEREEREAERQARRAKRAELDAFDAPVDKLDELVELVAHAALAAAGFRQHHRGEWRKKRVQANRPEQADDADAG